MRHALLRGREHTRIPDIAAVSEGPAALALSAGGARKRYPHAEPNEDAAGFAIGAGGCLLALADGHAGASASELAVGRMLERFAPAWTDARAAGLASAWRAQACDALAALNEEILRDAAGRQGPVARTTLVFALARPAEDLLAYASVGDSHLFWIAGDGAVDLAAAAGAATAFLGSEPETPGSLADKCVAGTADLGAASGFALVSDGLSERGIGVSDPAGAVAAALRASEAFAAELRPLAAARGIAECALAAQRTHGSGDNVAAAVYLPG